MENLNDAPNGETTIDGYADGEDDHDSSTAMMNELLCGAESESIKSQNSSPSFESESMFSVLGKAPKDDYFPKTERLIKAITAETGDRATAIESMNAALNKLDVASKALESGNLKSLKDLFGIAAERNGIIRDYSLQFLATLLADKYGVKVERDKDGAIDITYHNEHSPPFISDGVLVTRALHIAADGTITATKSISGGIAGHIKQTEPLDTVAALQELKVKLKAVHK